MKEKSKKDTNSASDKFIDILSTSLQKSKLYDCSLAFLEGDNVPIHLKFGSLSFGLLPLDIITGGGIPMGRIIEIVGDEGSGKSTLGYKIIQQTQLAGGISILLDSEKAVDINRLKLIGVDLAKDKLVYIQFSTLEQMFLIIKNILNTAITSKMDDKIITVVVDSIAAASTEREMQAEVGEPEVARRAQLMSQGLRMLTHSVSRTRFNLVFINQLRSKMNIGGFTPYGVDTSTSPGGKSLKFHATQRLALKISGQIKDAKTKETIGHKVKIKTIKCKTAPPFHTVEIPLFYNALALDNNSSIFMALKNLGIIASSGPAWKFKQHFLKEETKLKGVWFKQSEFTSLLEDNEKEISDLLKNNMFSGGSK